MDAVPEGTVVHAAEPLVRVEGPRLVCQLVESYLLNQVNFQTLIATKAARIVQAAAGRPVVDFGFRRAHGGEAGVLAARSAYIGGVVATATVAAGMQYGIPTTGTMSHSYVMGFPSELDAFCAFLHDQPSQPTLLIDTYETVSGARMAVEAALLTGVTPAAVRLDSGELDVLSREVRAVLDEGGLTATEIVCSGDLDEYSIAGWSRRRAGRRLRRRHAAGHRRRRPRAGRRLQAGRERRPPGHEALRAQGDAARPPPGLPAARAT